MPESAELKARAKEQLRGKWGTMALIWLITFAIRAIFLCLSLLLNASGGFARVVESMINLFVSTWTSLTWCGISLMLAKGEPIEVRDMFLVMPRFLSAVWTSFLSGLFFTLWYLLGLIPGFILGAILNSNLVIWLTIPAVIPAIMKFYAYSQALYIMVDNPSTTGTEPITYSREIMDGHKGELFWLGLTFLGWDILAVLTLGLLGFYTEPYMNTTYANFYLEVGGGSIHRASANAPVPGYHTDFQWQKMAP